jgi:ribonuclease III
VQREGFKFIYGNALEALIGAVYLDKGYKRCRGFILNRLLHLYIDLEKLIQTDTNYKSQLVTWASRNRKNIQFEIIAEKRAKRFREFTAQVLIEGQAVGQGQGSNKKQAEQQAAQAALATMGQVHP